MRAFLAVTLLGALAGCTPRTVANTTSPYVNPHAHEAIGTVRSMYNGTLTPALAVSTFRNIDRLFPTRTVAHGEHAFPLPLSATPLRNVEFTVEGKAYSLSEYLRVNRVSAMLVLKNGRIAYEYYGLGNTARSRWMSMSVAKSITSTLIGAAIQDGKIRSIDDLVTAYVPRLIGSAYDGVSIRQLLMMASGVRWNETYTDPTSDRRKLLEVQIAQQPGSAVQLMRTLVRASTPGTVNNYSTGETQIAGEVVRGAVGKPLAQYLSEKVWQPFGMETDASWWLDSPNGHEIGGSGFSATLRDYGRFGLFFLQGGQVGDIRVLPAGWTAEAGASKKLSNGQPLDYGYMWWPTHGGTGAINDGAFSAIGIFGQALYINPREHVVIVQWGAQTTPTGGDVVTPADFFAAVSMAVR